ncbi:uncharacterized protein LOC122132798 [Clupea harengus]|uniref:Uncharacterized protein LOC122132798 n=1 Tax=Clupea harengus TaxID=7950 RepID=A0A8M1KHI6_CLUHA|nr:uncharacterized protein LOC122132798 [Clupea harengus]
MERERERREEHYWDHQLFQAAQAAGSLPITPCSLPITPCCEHRQLKGGWCSCMWKLRVKARQLSIRLALEGPWNVLPSLRHGNHIDCHGNHRAQKAEWPHPSSATQILLLLQRKYDIIRERLYAEMLHEEHGGVWWESRLPWQREECVLELGVLAEHALSDRDLLGLCELPGAFRIYRQQMTSACGEESQPREQSWLARPLPSACGEESKPREQSWLARQLPSACGEESQPREQSWLAWTALVFLIELESSYQEESRALSMLMTS